MDDEFKRKQHSDLMPIGKRDCNRRSKLLTPDSLEEDLDVWNHALELPFDRRHRVLPPQDGM